jgi:lysophospholipase L1-like esterase
MLPARPLPLSTPRRRCATPGLPGALLLACLATLAAVPARAAERPAPHWRLPMQIGTLRPREFPDRMKLTAFGGELKPGPPNGPPQFEWQFTESPNGPTPFLYIPPVGKRGRDLLVFAVVETNPPRSVHLEMDARSDISPSDTPHAEQTVPANADIVARQCCLIVRRAADSPPPLAIKVEFTDATPVTVRLTHLQVFQYSPKTPPDGWLIVGASIDSAAFRDTDRFWRMARQRHPNADPLLVHLAIGGWRLQNVLDRVAETLSRHQEIRTVLVHIGGNDVTAERPYPGGAEQMRARLRRLLHLLVLDGRRVFLSRLSYRAYTGAKPVPPESNGSLPYNQAIYDPLIREYSPDLLDPETGQSRMDPYAYFHAHPEELVADGIHNTPKGQESWVRLWLNAVGPLVYGTGHPRRAAPP